MLAYVFLKMIKRMRECVGKIVRLEAGGPDICTLLRRSSDSQSGLRQPMCTSSFFKTDAKFKGSVWNAEERILLNQFLGFCFCLEFASGHFCQYFDVVCMESRKKTVFLRSG